MKPFTGIFYAVTGYSLFKITVPDDLISSPIVEKRHTKVLSADLGREMRVPVGGTFRKGFFVGITANGLYKYDVTAIQPQTVGTTLPPVEDVPGNIRSHRMTNSRTLVALFLHWRDAEVSTELPHFEESFIPRWHFQTREVITKIGLEHPLVSISRKGKYAIPQYLYDASIALPAVQTSNIE